MKRVINAASMRRLEQAAVDAGDSYGALMDRAGKAAADIFASRKAFSVDDILLVVCGNGNNGGDGFVIAERLCETTDAAVYVLLTAEESVTEIAKERFLRLRHTRACVKMLSDDPKPTELDALLRHVTYVVDAVYGIGFHGRLPLAVACLFDAVREMALPVLAVDIPSGICADDGTWDPHTPTAQLTVTFTALKPAMVSSARTLCGDIVVASVGIPQTLISDYEIPLAFLAESDVADRLPTRPQNGHKGTFGSALTLCGSYGMAGAALLCAKAALRSGVGLVHMALPSSVYPIVAGALWEAVCHPLPENDGCIAASQSKTVLTLADTAKAVVVGCGLSRCDEATVLLEKVLPHISVPMIVDADGLNILSEHIDWLKAMPSLAVVTPHPLEMARLLHTTVEAVERDRIGAAFSFATMHQTVVVLKGHRTVIAVPDVGVYINTTGTCGMATGGSGDVLSGMMVSFLAQGLSPRDAALCAVYLHGKVGEYTADRYGVTAMLPTDMIDNLPSLLSQYEKQE